MPSSPDADRSPSQAVAERMQFIASALLIIFVVGWFVWFYPYDDLLDRSGTPLGADYAMFYVAGQVVADGAADRLYDQAEHQRRLQALFPGIDQRFCLPFRYPPFVALLMAPLSQLPYAASYCVFVVISVAAWWWALRLLSQELTLLRSWARTPILVAWAGWPVVLETLIGGQASLLAVLIAAATIVCLRRGQWVWAGVILALAAYKPNVLALFGVGCLCYRPQLLRGAIPAAAVLAVLSLATVGSEGLWEYLALGTQLAGGGWDVETPYWKVHSLASWLAPLAAGRERLLACLLGLLAATWIASRWRRLETSAPDGQLLALGLLLTVNALFNAYTPIYDLALLGIAALLTAEALLGRTSPAAAQQTGPSMLAIQLLLGALYFGPHLSQMIARLTGWQLFALALAAIAIWQGRRFWLASCTAAAHEHDGSAERAVAGKL